MVELEDNINLLSNEVAMELQKEQAQVSKLDFANEDGEGKHSFF